ncbi:hypothetical protein GCM10023350_14180 [Nocardioides endophyticus]|uniref:Uncharacterized protein n=1 Tax=Nocardioides endophyticus TaxID=1353775 RepID=A0ABP8YJE1_9ACTN
MVSATDACPPGNSAADGVAGLSVTDAVVAVLPESEPLPDATQYAVAEPAARRTRRIIRASGIAPRAACLGATLTLTTLGIRGS